MGGFGSVAEGVVVVASVVVAVSTVAVDSVGPSVVVSSDWLLTGDDNVNKIRRVTQICGCQSSSSSHSPTSNLS